MVLFAWFSGEDVSIFYSQARGVFVIHMLNTFIYITQHFLYNHVLINVSLCVFSLFQKETSQILFGRLDFQPWLPLGCPSDDALELSCDGQLQFGLWYLGGFSNKNPRKGNETISSETQRKRVENWFPTLVEFRKRGISINSWNWLYINATHQVLW